MIMTRLLKTGAAALVAVVGLSTAGCIQSEDKTVIGKDGSGTAVVDMTVDLSKIEQMTEMFKGFGGGEPGMEPGMEGDKPTEPKENGLTDEMSEEKIKEKLKEHPGIELTKYTNEKKDGKQAIHMEFKFKDVADYAKADFFGNKSVELAKHDDGTYTLTFDPMGGQGDKLGGGGDAAGMAEADPMGGDPSMFMGMLEPFLGTLEVKSKITVPGTITETNGTKDGESTVGWAFGWKSMMEAMKDKKPVSWTVSFKGEGIELKPFKVKPDAEAMGKKMGGGMK